MFRCQLVHSYTFDDGSEVVEVVARAVDIVAHDAIREYFLRILKLLRHRGITVELRSSSGVDGVRELDHRLALGNGWVEAAGLSTVPYVNAWKVHVNQPGRRVEHVLSGVGLQIQPRETFMRRALADHPVPQAPEGYEVRVTPGDVIEVVVTSDGEEAASGLIAVVGEDAVPHRIRTSPDHRRRGLGSVVMGTLAREAVKAGATDGLLFASEDGLHLYRKLGWETVSDVVIASNSEGRSHDR